MQLRKSQRHSLQRGARPTPYPAVCALTVCFAVSLTLAAPLAAETALPAFKIHLERTGVYRVAFEDLAAAGLEGPLPSAGLGVTAAGRPVPVWVEDGGDGLFGPGDRLELVGERLRGEHSYSSEHTRYNVYFLRFDHPHPRRMEPTAAPADPPTPVGANHRLRSERHLEQDLLILRLPPAKSGEPEELWYWAKLVHNHQEPFVATLDLYDLDPGTGTVDLRIRLRGWSKPRSKPDPKTADHRVDVSLNGEPLASAEWNGTRPYLLEIPAVPAERLVQGENSLALAVPRRTLGEGGETLIDVVMLNWIEIAYPRRARVGREQAFFTLAEPAAPAAVRLLSEAGEEILVYGDGGSRTPASAMASERQGEAVVSAFHPAAGESSFIATSPKQLRRPDLVTFDRPSRLADPENRADYLMIAHRRLSAAAEPLAELHRARGLAVTVIDVEDVYDEFSHGVVHPGALRAFLEHAYHRWQRPAPRFVLLMGDASWDGKNNLANDANYADWTYRSGESWQFVKNRSTAYPQDAELNHRGLIPTWNHATYEGHAASDNYFVAVDGDDHLPDMAIGRLPVVTPGEVAAIVAKTVRYASAPEAGPWRRSVLFITNENRGYQRQSDRLAGLLDERGYASETIYPASSEVSNEHHTARLVDSFDRGQLIVHFLGHGGRYIWRTGPPDLKKNHDLFTLDHLEELAPSGRLPVVLSLTCYSAPFDHPSADSIGEKLLRLADRGAIAVVAASWRNNPSPRWGEILLAELTAPGATVGEALMRAKHGIRNRMFVETYNLLGDPAVPVALPAADGELRNSQDGAGEGSPGSPGAVGAEAPPAAIDPQG